MYCYVECFDNRFIKKEIELFDEAGDCHYCNSKNVSIADVGEVGEFIRKCLSKGYSNATRRYTLSVIRIPINNDS